MPAISALNTNAPTIVLNIITVILNTCVFLYISFRCIGITNHRKAAFTLISVTAMIFGAICTALTMLPSYDSSISLQLAHYMVHMFKTFIILAVIAICAEGYFPRNFIVMFLYCDLLTTIPFMPHHVINDLILKHYGLLSDQSIPGGYASPLLKTATDTLAWTIMLLSIMLVCRLFNRYLMPVLRRIPDTACLLFLMISFVTSVIKSVVLLKSDLYVNVTHEIGRGYSSIATSDIALILMMMLVFIIVLMLTATVLRQQLTRIIGLENDMLLDYYHNIAALHSSIRGMRHDLSNHLAALSFIGTGENAAGPGRQALMSTSVVNGVLEESGGCTPPYISGRCAETSRHASCGAGALRAPEDPGRCATGTPGDANRLSSLSSSTASTITADLPGDSIAPGSPAPAASSDPRDSYRRSLLEVCSEIDRQISEQTAWQQINTDALSSREKYEIYHYVTTVMQKHSIPASALCIKTETGDGNLEILLKISTDNNSEPARSAATVAATNTPRSKALHLPLLRHGTMFRLITLIAQSHGGDAAWRKAGDGCVLVVTIRQQS